MREWTEPQRPLAGPPPATLTTRGAVVCALVSVSALTAALFLGQVDQCRELGPGATTVSQECR